jgi:hypothetical protein
MFVSSLSSQENIFAWEYLELLVDLLTIPFDGLRGFLNSLRFKKIPQPFKAWLRREIITVIISLRLTL